MATSQRDVRNRISAVKNIQKITRAMEMVAAARMRRAQSAVTAGRPYAAKIAWPIRAAFADWRAAENKLYIRASVGGVHVLRDTLTRCLGLERGQVVALAEDVGGSFGAKNHPYPEYILAAAISRLVRRPVRWVADRSEDGHTTGQAHGHWRLDCR